MRVNGLEDALGLVKKILDAGFGDSEKLKKILKTLQNLENLNSSDLEYILTFYPNNEQAKRIFEQANTVKEITPKQKQPKRNRKTPKKNIKGFVIGTVAAVIVFGIFLAVLTTSESSENAPSSVNSENISSEENSEEGFSISFGEPSAISVPVTYEIDSRCDFSYFFLDLNFVQEKGIGTTFTVDKDKQIAWEKSELEKIQDARLKTPLYKRDEVVNQMFEEYRTTLFVEYTLRPFFEQNSIDPNLQEEITPWLYNLVVTQHPDYTAQMNYEIMRVTEYDFEEDPECAVKHKRDFSETMDWLRGEWGY